jgi:ubiquinone/menaquinone biosynthesis C-methylase UbiE
MVMKKSKDEIRNAVRKHYGEAISRKGSGGSSCCSPEPVQLSAEAINNYARLAGYTSDDLKNLPQGVTTFGCGNPVNFIEVKKGETVLDLGSGPGLDLILAAKKVGTEGKVIGLDMTDEMIAACRKNLETAGITNGEVRKGLMEEMPVADGEVDWIISNCVINLSPEKEKVFAEAFRVLRPGGKMLVSDIVTNDLPDECREDILAWVGCLAGAVEEDEYLKLIRDAGFEDVKILDKMVYDHSSLATLAGDACSCGDGTVTEDMVGKFSDRVASVKVFAVKPA